MTVLRLALAAALLAGTAAAQTPDPYAARVAKVLKSTPLIDGHNDLPWAMREAKLKVETTDLLADQKAAGLHTDLPRLKAGGVGAQFWSVYVPADLQGDGAVTATFEQIDLVHRLAAKYPDRLEVALTADDVVRIHRRGEVASLIGMEGGHSIDSSLSVLRQVYAAGARYMTITHSKNVPWADSATDAPNLGGLSPFGEEVIREMNRLGMLVDLSHVSVETMKDAMRVSEAPVIFSHSSAFALTDHPRNVPDEVLRMLPEDGGVVMVTFVPGFVSPAIRAWNAERAAKDAALKALHPGDPARARRELEAWITANPSPRATLAQVADHVEHVREVAGIDHVGIGSDFDGIPTVPENLDGVEDFPALLSELMRRGWTDAEIRKLVGENALRVMRRAEAVSARLKTERRPSEATLAELDASAAPR